VGFTHKAVTVFREIYALSTQYQKRKRKRRRGEGGKSLPVLLKLDLILRLLSWFSDLFALLVRLVDYLHPYIEFEIVRPI
jgi:hypothetical protein